MLCTAAVLKKTPVGPEVVSPSTGTLAASLSSQHVDQVTADKTSLVAESAQFHVTSVDLLSAPLMVAELTVGDSPLAETELKDANFGPEYNV